MTALGEALWPEARLEEAVGALAAAAGWRPGGPGFQRPEGGAPDGREPGRCIDLAARGLGLQAEPVEARYGEHEGMLRGCGPAIVHVPAPGGPGFLVVRGGRRRSLTVLTPGGRTGAVALGEVQAAVCGPLEEPHAQAVEALLGAAGVPARGRPRSRRLLLAQLLGRQAVSGVWVLRPGAGSSLLDRLGGRRFQARLAGLLAVQLTQYSVFLLSWWVMGTLALTDRFGRGWLFLWLLLLATFIALRMHIYAAMGSISIEVGAHLKRHLLEGAFRLDPDRVRRLGAGQLLGRTLEVEAIETFSFMGAMYLVMGVTELGFAGVVLAMGSGGTAHALLLLGWIAVAAVTGAAYCRERLRWTDERIGLTDALVEQLVGHRTRVAQEGPGRVAGRDEAMLERYDHRSRRLNRLEVAVGTGVPRGWFAVGLLALLPAFVQGGAAGGKAVAAVGGVIVAYRAFRILVTSTEQLAGALVAWKRLAPFRAAEGVPEAPGSPAMVPAGEALHAPGPLVEMARVTYRHPGRADPTLFDVELTILRRDRILLEGPSGGGKSTLGGLLASCRPIQGGLLLLDGLDAPTLGHRAWRRRVVLVPQFHENHVLMGSLAFNLLLGRGWPPAPGDLREAEAVCRGLGLGPLLERMPGGLFQMVGDTGWQLSHGERSRIFIARAVLQKPDLLILDESLAALDPELFRSSVDYLLKGDAAVLLIAHP
ncbi:MAG TPA: ABC transporter ATP-binding protein [Longimicrobium sp.]|uniref:ABC transporter ATP-binding protein n=1 Tax=Longimicrobium sp. TaxID=2029185 RepID=UPI002EDA746D